MRGGRKKRWEEGEKRGKRRKRRGNEREEVEGAEEEEEDRKDNRGRRGKRDDGERMEWKIREERGEEEGTREVERVNMRIEGMEWEEGERREEGWRGKRRVSLSEDPPVFTGQTPEAPWSFLAWGPWGPLSPCPSLWTRPWCPRHQNQGSSSPLGLRAWTQQPPLPPPAPPQLQLPHWPTTGMLRPIDTPQVTSLGGCLGTGSVLLGLPWRPSGRAES